MVAAYSAGGIEPSFNGACSSSRSLLISSARGTGIIARSASDIVGSSGKMVGLDLNPGMLAVARRLLPDLEWVQHDATALPFSDVSFERVVCRFALMFFPDRLGAPRELCHVLAPGGVVAVATWDSIEVSPPCVRQAEIVDQPAGLECGINRALPIRFERSHGIPGVDRVGRIWIGEGHDKTEYDHLSRYRRVP